MPRALPTLAAALLVGCTPEQEFHEIPIEAIAVAAGDYDRMEAVLLRQNVTYQLYEGYIVGATYEPELDPDIIALEVETLLATEEIDYFGALFLNSGTRGLGQYVYNGVDADDTLVSSAEVVDNVVRFVSGGGVLVVSDWAYDIVEAGWPEMLTFAGDETVFDDAQRGSRGTVQAMVHDSKLVDELGQNLVSITYDFSHFAVVLEASDDVDVYLTGDLSYRASESEGDVELEDVPLLVGFQHGQGHVYFSNFHWDAQTSAAADTILFTIVEGLYPGGGEEEDTGQEPEDTGS